MWQMYLRAILASMLLAILTLRSYGDDAHQHIRNALEHDGDSEYCIRELTEAIRIAPGLSFAYSIRAVHRKEVLDLSGALADLDRAIELGDERMAVCCLMFRAMLFAEQREYESAIVDLNKVLLLKPTNILCIRLKTQLLMRQGLVPQAMHEATNAIVQMPESIDLLCLYGQVAYKHGDIDGAINAYARASSFLSSGKESEWNESRHEADTALAQFFCGFSGFESYRDPIAALHHARLARQRSEGKSYRAWEMVSLAYYVNGHFEQFDRSMSQAIVLAPEDERARLSIVRENVRKHLSSRDQAAGEGLTEPVGATEETPASRRLERLPVVR